ncbi:MAG: hypothetical protein K0S65_4059, partial [Labilithrix sp.]|nr:hypothetical protein [Labilithrix sp.]
GHDLRVTRVASAGMWTLSRYREGRLDAHSFGPEVNIKLCKDMAKVVALTWAGKRLRTTRAREAF